MSLYIDQTYIGIMGNRLPLFRQLKPNLYNFRCPICGDSSKNEFKRRAYFYVTKSGDSFGFQCHNCGASHSLYTFISLLFPEMLGQYKAEKFISSVKSGSSKAIVEEAIPFKKKIVSENELIQITKLPWNHVAVKYITETRKLPKETWKNFYFVENYVDWLRKTTQDDDIKLREHSRILIPYTNKNGQVYRYVARSIDPKFEPKYLYTDIDIGSPFYNWDQIDKGKRVYVLEGQIDSMLVPNSIALGNAKYDSSNLKDLHDFVVVGDNQPRNQQVVDSYKKAIDSGLKICIWPSYKGKDINEMILNGLSVDEILKIIDDNTYHGFMAKVKFEQWRKI